MKILLLSRYDTLGASSRVRSFQYLPFLREQGLSVSVSSLFPNDYIIASYSGAPKWKYVVNAYFRRLAKLRSIWKYDLLIIEKELFPFIPALFERFLRLIGKPYLVDYDDALFHRYDCHKSALVRFYLGKKIDVVMRNASVVVAGNQYLAERAKAAGARHIVQIPTVVDIKKYRPVKQPRKGGAITVGWIGTPKTSHYLKPLVPVFERLKKKHNVKFVAIGADKTDFLNSPIEVHDWSEKTEVSSIQKLDVGIMPLTDSPWERGKCGYKLIQYMACGLPVVASPVGVNSELIEQGYDGFLATTPDDWEKMISKLLESEHLRESMGQQSRSRVKKHYSIQVQRERLLSAIKSVR